MQTIITKCIHPTTCKGQRIKATASGGMSITLEWDDALNSEKNHLMAARALVAKLDWNYGTWYSGGTKDGDLVWVCCDPTANLGVDYFHTVSDKAA